MDDNVRVIDFNANSDTADKSEKPIIETENINIEKSAYEDGYYVELYGMNNTFQVVTSEKRDFKSAKDLYKTIKSEIEDGIKTITLFKYEDNIRINIYTKSYNNNDSCDQIFILIEDTIKQIEKLQGYINHLNDKQSIADKSINILLHSIECSDYINDEQAAQDFMKLKLELSKRREVKNMMSIKDKLETGKILPKIIKMNLNSEKAKLNLLKSNLQKKITDGIKNSIDTTDKMCVMKFADEDEKNKILSVLKSKFNCTKIDDYNKVVTGYNLIYK